MGMVHIRLKVDVPVVVAFLQHSSKHTSESVSGKRSAFDMFIKMCTSQAGDLRSSELRWGESEKSPASICAVSTAAVRVAPLQWLESHSS